MIAARFDLAIVGAGILGLAHALAGLRRGLRVVVIDREAEAVGASVRNFGFVCPTGQAAGECWNRAMRSRDVWAEVAPKAGIAIEQQGLLVLAQRTQALQVLEAFVDGEMGQGCELLSAARLRTLHGAVIADRDFAGAMWSPHERRVESRQAIPKLAAWLEAQGVVFLRRRLVTAVQTGRVLTTGGEVRAGAVVVCPGDDLLTLFPDLIAGLGISRCRLQMLKVAVAPGFPLPGAVMSDQSLIRYPGYAGLPGQGALHARLLAEQPQALAEGIHLIAVQGADGALIVGDSHHYEWSPQPFGREAVDDLILDELQAVLNVGQARVVERWMGTYATLPDRLMVRQTPEDGVRLVIVTSGTGASTGFAIAEETIDELYGKAAA